MVCRRCVRIGLVAGLLAYLLLPLLSPQACAEWYVAGQVGVNFADPLRNVRGTGTLAGLDAPNFNLKTSHAFGGKLGVFPSHGMFGFELDLSRSTAAYQKPRRRAGHPSHGDQHRSPCAVALSGRDLAPYIGGGPAVLVAHLRRSSTTESDTQLSFGGNLLVGIRAFVTPKVAFFTE